MIWGLGNQFSFLHGASVLVALAADNLRVLHERFLQALARGTALALCRQRATAQRREVLSQGRARERLDRGR